MKKGADTVFGHEFRCEVTETSGAFKAGDAAVSVPGLLSATGFESIGYFSRIPGGFADELLLSEMLMLPVPNGLSPEHAALTEPLAVGEHAVAMATPAADDVLLLIGCGPVGLAGDRRAEGARGRAGDRSGFLARAPRDGGAHGRRSGGQPRRRLAAPILGGLQGPSARAKAMTAQMSGAKPRRPVIVECVGAPETSYT